MTTIQAIRFVKMHGIVMESVHCPLPNLAERIVGKRIRGSWWVHPKRQEIFRLTRAVRDSEDILVCRFMKGKVTYVHKRLWPSLVRLESLYDGKSLGRICEVHKRSGEHVVNVVPYPKWVPARVKVSARNLSEKQALRTMSVANFSASR